MLLGVSIVVFFMVRAIPGDPAQLLLGQQATQEQVQQVRQNMGLDKPVIVQYGIFLADALRGDLGQSIVTGRPVTTELLARFPTTLELTTLGRKTVGDPVNLEVDVMAKYVEKLLAAGVQTPLAAVQEQR